MTDNDNDEDTLREINDSLYRKGATDGMPVIPPTDARVEEMLAGTDLPPEHVIGHLGNGDAPLTVQKLATNAVMAGCVPPHLPVLIAGAKALADPDSNSISFSVSTTGWAYLWTINGPVRNDLDIRCRGGAYGPGFRANQVIGRALGLAYKNTTHLHPGEKDMATLGNPFKYSLVAGENQEQSPWEPYHVTHGFEERKSTITLAGPSSFVTWTPYRNDPEHILEGMIYHMDPYVTGRDYKTVWHMICPYSAEQLGNAGLSKHDVKKYVSENSWMPATKYARGKYQDRELERSNQGEIPNLQHRQIADLESLKLVTLGGPGTVNAVIGPSIGGPVTKEIEFPENWEQLVEEYHVEREWGRTSEVYG